MTAIAERVAAGHVYIWSAAHCSCGEDVWGEDFPHHVAAATEAAVRAQIAADIKAEADRLDNDMCFMTTASGEEGTINGLDAAADIAKDGAP